MKNQIRELRKIKNYRQEDIANELGVTRQTINAIENDKYDPTLSLAMKIAKLLNKPLEEVFYLEQRDDKSVYQTAKRRYFAVIKWSAEDIKGDTLLTI